VPVLKRPRHPLCSSRRNTAKAGRFLHDRCHRRTPLSLLALPLPLPLLPLLRWRGGPGRGGRLLVYFLIQWL
jgi:hypothetical protein